MNHAAREYVRALANRNQMRHKPPHEVDNLQRAVNEIAARLAASRDDLTAAVGKRFGPTRAAVQRVGTDGVYVIGYPDGRSALAVRRGPAGPATEFWDVRADASLYLDRDKAGWTVTYGPDAGARVTVDEYWTSTGLR